MKHTGKLALCGVMSALATAIMLFSYFPALTYAVPALAGIVFMILVVEIDSRWALMAYLTTCALVLLLADPEAKLMFIAFFGYYPILKGILQRLRSRKLQWVLKFAVFNVAVAAAYSLMIFVFHLPMEDMNTFGKYSLFLLWIMGNVAFWLYDVAITGILQVYLKTLHPKLKKLIR